MPDYPLSQLAGADNIMLRRILFALMNNGAAGLAPEQSSNTLLRQILYAIQNQQGGGGGGGAITLSGDVSGSSSANTVDKIAGVTPATGVPAALGIAPNTAGGFLTVNSNGYSSPSVSQPNSNFLLLGFNGAFLSGYERFQLVASGNGTSWKEIRGWEKYNPTVPPDSAGYTCGVRDPAIIHFPNGTYLVGHTISRNNTVGSSGAGSTSGYIGFAKAQSLSAPLTFVANIDTSSAIAPKFLYTLDGRLYADCYGYLIENTSRTGGYPDGVTWTARAIITWVDGTVMNTSDQCQIQTAANSFGVFYWRNGAGFVYRIGTSSSVGSGYTDQGIITNWPTAEGVSVSQDTTTGIWYAYFQARSGTYNGKTVVSTSSTPLVAASWTAPVPLDNVTVSPATMGSNPVASFDNAGSLISSNASVMLDVLNATQQQEYAYWSGPDSPPRLTYNTSQNYSSINVVYPTGEGTVAINNGVVTGTGTRFQKRFQVGSLLITASRTGIVRAVASDTSMTLLSSSNYTVAAGAAYTYAPPLTQVSTYNGNTVVGFDDAITGYVWRNGVALFNVSGAGFMPLITTDSSGNLILQNISVGGGGSYVYGRFLTSGGNFEIITGNLAVATAGKGLQIKEGTNARQGVGTLVAGTLTVANTSVTASSRVIVWRMGKNASSAIGALDTTISAGVGFTVTSLTNLAATATGDVSSFGYLITEGI